MIPKYINSTDLEEIITEIINLHYECGEHGIIEMQDAAFHKGVLEILKKHEVTV